MGGGGARLRFPLWQGLFIGTEAGAAFGGVVWPDDEGATVLPPSELFPGRERRVSVGVEVGFDRRDSQLQPRNGVLAVAEGSYAGPGTLSQIHAIRTEATLQLYATPLFGITWKSQTRLGALFGPTSGVLPATERFFPGGFGTVRGYRPRSIAPRADVVDPTGQVHSIHVGGTRMLVQNLEVEAPLFLGTPFRGFLFVDAGNAFASSRIWPPIDIDDDVRALPLGVYWSVGGGVLLETPVFPLRFEWSVPLFPREREGPLDFFFGVGSGF
jgi:outer membrane protein assembly factor BamA